LKHSAAVKVGGNASDCRSIPVRHSGGPLGLTLTLTLTAGMADLRNGGPPEWGAGTSPFPRLPFLKSTVLKTQKSTFFQWEYMFPRRKDSFIHGNARSGAATFQPCSSYTVPFSRRVFILLLSLTCWQECEGYCCCWNYPIN